MNYVCLNNDWGKDKFDPERRKYIFVRYSDKSKDYCLSDPYRNQLSLGDIIFMNIQNENETMMKQFKHEWMSLCKEKLALFMNDQQQSDVINNLSRVLNLDSNSNIIGTSSSSNINQLERVQIRHAYLDD